MTNLSELSNEALLAAYRAAVPSFLDSSGGVGAYLTELKFRFMTARNRKELFCGYSSWNKFVLTELKPLDLTRVRLLTPAIKLQNHKFKTDWRLPEFGNGCYAKHDKIGRTLLQTVASKFKDFAWGGWSPWRPCYDSDVKAGYVPVEDRYKVTLFLTAEQIRGLNVQQGV